MGLAGCASAGGETPGGPDPAAEGAGVPGFDTRTYPGDDAMDAWRRASPYRWVGYYLPAPCYTGTSWQGKRARLEASGWGMAVLFVGEQDWAAMGAPAAADTAGADPTAAAREARGGTRCTASTVTAQRGAEDGARAAAAAAAEGFPEGSWIYLDVERVDSVSAALAGYVGAWTGALLDEGRYRPGLYAHRRNVAALAPIVDGAIARRGGGAAARIWVAGGDGFDLGAHPADSGVRRTTVWQGAFDVTESWGGVELIIDRNVADRASPSGG